MVGFFWPRLAPPSPALVLLSAMVILNHYSSFRGDAYTRHAPQLKAKDSGDSSGSDRIAALVRWSLALGLRGLEGGGKRRKAKMIYRPSRSTFSCRPCPCNRPLLGTKIWITRVKSTRSRGGEGGPPTRYARVEFARAGYCIYPTTPGPRAPRVCSNAVELRSMVSQVSEGRA